MAPKGGNKKNNNKDEAANKIRKKEALKKPEKLHLKSKLEFRIWFLVLLLCFTFSSIFIFYVRQKILKEMVWEPITLEKPKSYEQVLLSVVNGTVKSLQERTFLIEAGGIEADGKEIKLYINANTRLFDKEGKKLSEEPGFSFSDYLKNGQKVKILYAPYDKILIASEIWLTE